MSPLDPPAEALKLSLSIFLVWVLWGLWRRHRVDACRHRLFGLRDRLFDLAVSGTIDFDNQSYRDTRDLLNALIRFAHKLTMLRYLAMSFISVDPAGLQRMGESAKRIDKLPAPAADALREMHNEARKIALEQVFGFPCLAFFALIIVLFRAATALLRAIVDLLYATAALFHSTPEAGFELPVWSPASVVLASRFSRRLSLDSFEVQAQEASSIESLRDAPQSNPV